MYEYKLTDQHIVQLSEIIVSDSMCVKLGITLGLKMHQIQVALHNHERDITSAVQDILHKWLQMKENRIIAWKELAAALTKCDMTFWVADILKK